MLPITVNRVLHICQPLVKTHGYNKPYRLKPIENYWEELFASLFISLPSKTAFSTPALIPVLTGRVFHSRGF